ncbi:hypothetical protein [Gemmatimonas sp.]|uniref:hypothetical protein n=1 Tax=Gemmatimonas sp. TaxID=1962908 RepID=UPI00333E3A52
MVIIVLLVALLVAPMALPSTLAAQGHEHAASPPGPDARLQLVLGGPHLILYHTGYLALGESQVAGLQRLRRAVCDAEVVYVERTATGRDRLSALLADSVSLPRESAAAPTKSSALPDAMNALAAAETAWLTALLRTRRDALGLLTTPQRAQLSTLRDHWVRESLAMIEESTRPGQRGHPGTQLPIRVPGMVVGPTTLLPYCESLHGPSMHISMPGVPPQGRD